MSIERLRALEKDIRESVALADAEALGVMGINRPARWADELASLIAELGQEVGAVAPLKVFSAGRWVYEGSPHPAEFDSTELDAAAFAAYRTSPAHTSEARGCRGRFFASGPNGLHFYADSSDFANRLIVASGYDRDDWTVTDLHNPAGDAAMRQEAE